MILISFSSVWFFLKEEASLEIWLDIQICRYSVFCILTFLSVERRGLTKTPLQELPRTKEASLSRDVPCQGFSVEWLLPAHVLELLVPADVAILRGYRTFGTWGLVAKRRHRGTSWLQPSVALVVFLCFLLHSISSHSHSKNPSHHEPHSMTAEGKQNSSSLGRWWWGRDRNL